MKVVSGLDWIDEPVHYPEKLIDMCLKTQPKSEGGFSRYSLCNL